MRRERAQLAQDAARALKEASARLVRAPAVVGFDGYIDTIIRVVDKRQSMAPDDFAPIRTIPEFAARCAAAAGKSANVELHVIEDRFGGNGPLMAGALGRLGMPTTYIGNIGRPDAPRDLHPLYAPFAERCEEVICLAPPAFTDALEFDDGKLMLGKPRNAQQVTWDRLMEIVGIERLVEIYERSSLIGIVNWTLSGGVQGIWEGLIEHVLPRLGPSESRRVMIDLSDPAKRTLADIAGAMATLREMNTITPVTLGLNLSESQRIDEAVGAGAYPPVEGEPTHGQIARAAGSLRAALGLDTVVIHPRDGAAACDGGEPEWFGGPFTRAPRLSTGAGDHFNAGFAFAQTLGLGQGEALAVGCGVSGVYVRDAVSPTLERLREFLDEMPEPEA